MLIVNKYTKKNKNQKTTYHNFIHFIKIFLFFKKMSYN